MRYLVALIVVLALAACMIPRAPAQTECRNPEEVHAIASQNATRVLALEGAEAARVGRQLEAPVDFSHLLVYQREDGALAVFGFVDGCLTHMGTFHREVFEAKAPGVLPQK